MTEVALSPRKTHGGSGGASGCCFGRVNEVNSDDLTTQCLAGYPAGGRSSPPSAQLILFFEGYFVSERLIASPNFATRCTSTNIKHGAHS